MVWVHNISMFVRAWRAIIKGEEGKIQLCDPCVIGIAKGKGDYCVWYHIVIESFVGVGGGGGAELDTVSPLPPPPPQSNTQWNDVRTSRASEINMFKYF